MDTTPTDVSSFEKEAISMLRTEQQKLTMFAASVCAKLRSSSQDDVVQLRVFTARQGRSTWRQLMSHGTYGLGRYVCHLDFGNPHLQRVFLRSNGQLVIETVGKSIENRVVPGAWIKANSGHVPAVMPISVTELSTFGRCKKLKSELSMLLYVKYKGSIEDARAVYASIYAH